jgi:hypothetical protein
MATVADYYRILQLSEGSTVAQIKAAYRSRAKQLHPDRNPGPTAHADFILLTEAYEYLSANPAARITYTSTSYTTYTRQTDWQQQYAEPARQRAQTHASMSYEDFVASDYFKDTDALALIADHINMLFLVIIMSVISVLCVMGLGLIGLVPCALTGLVIYRYVKNLVTTDDGVHFMALKKSVGLIFKKDKFWAAIAFAFNLWVFCKIGLQTFIPFALLWKVYLLVVLLAFGMLKVAAKPKGVFKSLFLPVCLVPLLLSTLLLVNYTFSHTPVKEMYEYRLYPDKPEENNGTQMLIYLPENQYGNYPGIRFFLNEQEMRGTYHITYTFEDGLLGLRVMKAYSFE